MEKVKKLHDAKDFDEHTKWHFVGTGITWTVTKECLLGYKGFGLRKIWQGRNLIFPSLTQLLTRGSDYCLVLIVPFVPHSVELSRKSQVRNKLLYRCPPFFYKHDCLSY